MYNEEFIKSVMDKLDLMNIQQGINSSDFKNVHNTKIEGLGRFDLLDQMGRTAIEYMKNKKNVDNIGEDPLFPNRN